MHHVQLNRESGCRAALATRNGIGEGTRYAGAGASAGGIVKGQKATAECLLRSGASSKPATAG